MNTNELFGLALKFTRYLGKHPDARKELESFYPRGSISVRGDEQAAQLVTRALDLKPPLTLSDMDEFKAGMRAVHANDMPPEPWWILDHIALYHSGGGHP